MEQTTIFYLFITYSEYTLSFPYVPVALDNFLFECVAWTSQVIHFVVISQWRFYFLQSFTLSATKAFQINRQQKRLLILSQW